jgi:23S rRNA pseudouridine1911/1915/1917 synthase
MRLDAYLAQKHPEYSRATWQKFIEAGYIQINGRVAKKTTSVSSNDNVLINVPKNALTPLKLPIIYEDKNVLIIDKPAGVLTHSKGALNDEFTVSDFVKSKSDVRSRGLSLTTFSGKSGEGRQIAVGEAEHLCPPSARVDEHSILPINNRFGIVHRLDRGTSGVIIGAKNPETLKFLQKQFANRQVKKTYLALVEKASGAQSSTKAGGPGVVAPKDKEFIIDLPIGRNPKKPATFRIDPKGKPAITNVKLIQTFDNGTALLELKPQTGRTHQLRVHLAHIGSPIIGDPIYGKAANGRMMLHASELEITIPGGERKTFISKLPTDFGEGN